MAAKGPGQWIQQAVAQPSLPRWPFPNGAPGPPHATLRHEGGDDTVLCLIRDIARPLFILENSLQCRKKSCHTERESLSTQHFVLRAGAGWGVWGDREGGSRRTRQVGSTHTDFCFLPRRHFSGRSELSSSTLGRSSNGKVIL